MEYERVNREPVFGGLLKFVCFLALILVVGTLGYAFVENWPLSDGLYMTVITLSTVGYGETQELSQPGRWFTVCLIGSCVIAMACFTAMLTSVVLEESLSGRSQHRRIVKMISELNGHVIVCGSDMMAQAIVEQMFRKRKAVVVIDNNAENLDRLRRRFRRLFVIEGKATDEMTLAEANVLASDVVVAAMDSEFDNLLVGISCKALGEVTVYARANDPTVANSMRKAGIDQVVSPNQLCGQHVCQMIEKPTESKPLAAATV